MNWFPKNLVRALIPAIEGNNRLNRFLQKLRRRSFRIFYSCSDGYFSQTGQDKFLNEAIFRRKRNGFFVEIGAADGVTFSNTYFFEKELNWSGICVEPRPEGYANLCAARKCLCLQACITDFSGSGVFLQVDDIPLLSGLISKYDPRHLQRVRTEVASSDSTSRELEVPCYTFDQLMRRNGLSEIDYLSIDTEGGELDLLRSIDFARFRIKAISVENSFADPRFERLMNKNGYELVAVIGDDDIYVRGQSTRCG